MLVKLFRHHTSVVVQFISHYFDHSSWEIIQVHVKMVILLIS